MSENAIERKERIKAMIKVGWFGVATSLFCAVLNMLAHPNQNSWKFFLICTLVIVIRLGTLYRALKKLND
jgi:hypothetical protein